MSKRNVNRRLFARACEAVFNQPWLITQEKFDAIVGFLSMRSEGFDLSEEEIEAHVSSQSPIYAAMRSAKKEDQPVWSVIDGVAVIPVAGTLTQRTSAIERSSGIAGMEDIAQWVKEASEDRDVKAILLNIDSPGGTVTGTPELANAVYQARAIKPVAAFSNGLMCSAAYWVGSAASKIMSLESSLTGSIGVVSLHRDWSRAWEEYGVKNTLITFGQHKVDGNPYEALNSQSRATMQERVDACGEMFVSAVARNRGISAEQVTANYGQGKVFMGNEAIRLGLVDQVVGSFAEALNATRGLASSTNHGSARQSTRAEHHHQASTSLQTDRPRIQENSNVNAKIKSGLFFQGIVESADVSDELATVALNGWFSAKGIAKPSNDEDILKALLDRSTNSNATAANTTENKAAAAENLSIDAARQQGRTEENYRQNDIRSRATLLGAGVTNEMITAAIEGNQTGDQAAAQWTKDLAKNSKGLPRIENGTAGEDVFAADATDAISLQMNIPLKDAAGKPRAPSALAAELRYAKPLDIAKMSLERQGMRTNGLDDIAIATEWLRQTGPEKGSAASWISNPRASAGSFNTPSRLPNVLSGVATRSMEMPLDRADLTYTQWAKQKEAFSDDSPRLFLRASTGGTLDRVGDRQPIPERYPVEEGNFMFVDRYAAGASITPIMVVRNQLGIAFESLFGLNQMMYKTIQELCIMVLESNPTLLDGTTLFHSSRGNLYSNSSITVGGTTMAAARKFFSTVKDVDGVNTLRLRPRTGLFTPDRIEEAEKYLLPIGDVGGVYPTSESGANVHRKNRYNLLEEPDLSGSAAQNNYFWFTDPSNGSAVNYAFMQGYEGGRRENYWNPETKCQVFDLESWFGAAPGNWRLAMKFNDE